MQFSVGFSLCRNGTCVIWKAVVWWSNICASESVRRLGLLSGKLALVSFGCKQLRHLFVCFSTTWTQLSSYYAFCVWRICHDIRPECLPLLVFQPPWAVYLSNRIVWGNSFRNLCHRLGLVSFSVWVYATFWGFVSVFGYDLHFCQDFQVSETRMCFSAILVYLI